MDKRTLSNYGWVIICVLVLVVMMSLATPFGKYVSDSFKNITTSFTKTPQDNFNITMPDFLEEKTEEIDVVLVSGAEFHSILSQYHDSQYLNINHIKKIEFSNKPIPADVEIVDVSASQDGTAVAWYENNVLYVSPKNPGKTLYANPNSSWMFAVDNLEASSYGPNHVEEINFENFDTSKVVNMNSMFYESGCSSQVFKIRGLSNWNTSNVVDMSSMFSQAGVNATIWEIDDISNWKTSNVVDMSNMFFRAGGKSSVIELNFSSWDVSNVADMHSMFDELGCFDASEVRIVGLENWQPLNVQNMSYMFASMGCNANYLLDLSMWSQYLKNIEYYNGFERDVENKIISPWEQS